MTECQRCRAKNDPASRFCVNCGCAMTRPSVAPAPAAPSQQPPAPVFQSEAPQSKAAPPPSSGFAFAETAPPLMDPDENPMMAGSRQAVGTARAPAAAPPPPSAHSPYPTALPGNASGGKHPLSVPPDAPRVLAGFLASYEGAELGQAWFIYQGKNLVGRQGAAPDLDLEIAHATTSSRHCVFSACAHPARIALEDLGSTNGTFVNDIQLAPNRPHELNDGDRVRFGLFTAVIKII